METNNILIRVADSNDTSYAIAITDEMENSAKARGTGIAKRSPDYIEKTRGYRGQEHMANV